MTRRSIWFWRALRYLTLVCFAAWTGASVGLGMWAEACFFLGYMAFLYLLGKRADEALRKEDLDVQDRGPDQDDA